MAYYKQPRRLNIVSFGLLAFLAAGVYALYVFFPIYWDAWTVDHQLRDGAAKVYNLNSIQEPARTTELQKMLQKVQADCVRLAGITDPDFAVSLDVEGEEVCLRGEYDVPVTYPLIGSKTVVHMKRMAKANVKRVQWE